MERPSIRDRARVGGLAGLIVAVVLFPPFVAQLGAGGGTAAAVAMAVGVTVAVVVLLGLTRPRDPER